LAVRDALYSFLGFVAVVAGLAIVAGGVWLLLQLAGPSRDDVFGEERWTCGKWREFPYEVAWEPKEAEGTDISVKSPERVDFFGLSCLPNEKSHCFDNPGWKSARIDVTGAGAPVSISFAPDSANVDAMRHHADVYWELARSIIAAFRAGKTAEVVTLGAKGEVLKVTKVNLDGFGPAMDTCIAIWAKTK
jgi:hypothetical protein